MQEAVLALALLQSLGAALGAFYAVWGEMAYVRAMKDGSVDQAERAHLHALAKSLRVGMFIMLVASIGLIVLAYEGGNAVQPALTASYWILMGLALVLISVSWALSKKRISFALGSAIAFTGWWFVAFLTFGFVPEMTFGAALALYVVMVGVFYAILSYARFLLIKK